MSNQDRAEGVESMNGPLCDFSTRWKFDGDYIRCLNCDRPQIASCHAMDFPHAEWCQSVGMERHPWLTFAEIIRPIQPRTATPQAPGADTPGGRGEGEATQVYCFRFGLGGLAISTGQMDGDPCVFIREAYVPGVVGEPIDQSVETPLRAVLCFPTDERAYEVQSVLIGSAHSAESSGGDAVDAARYRWLRDNATRAELEVFANRRGTRLAADRVCDASRAAIASGAEHGTD